jgi:hypothetical protein
VVPLPGHRADNKAVPRVKGNGTGSDSSAVASRSGQPLRSIAAWKATRSTASLPLRAFRPGDAVGGLAELAHGLGRFLEIEACISEAEPPVTIGRNRE